MKPASLSRMIYTPKARIPIGEGVELPNGSYALRVKKPNEDRYDIIPLDILYLEVVTSAKRGAATGQGATTV